jgi:DegV family protein with EDD domain
MQKRTVAIVTDSTAHLPKELVSQLDIRVVPLLLHWGADTYRDEIDIQSEEFYARLKSDPVIPTTSAPSIGDFQAVYNQALQTADAVLSLHIASPLSATFSTAEQAKALMPGKQIEVIDSRQTAMALGFGVLAAARAAEQGQSLEQVAAAAQRALANAHIIFTVETLEYLRRGGRIGSAQAFVGNLMDVKPILELRDGRIEAVERARTKKKALDRLVDMIVAFCPDKTPVRIAAIHALRPDEAKALVKATSARLVVAETVVTDISPVIATHTGPGTVGLICCPA